MFDFCLIGAGLARPLLRRRTPAPLSEEMALLPVNLNKERGQRQNDV